MKGHKICAVAEGSIAAEMEVEAGDVLLEVNGLEIKDVFDYHYAVNDEYLVLLVEKPDGEQWELEIEKDLEEDIGLSFEEGLMDEYQSCRNKCIFCFIDQMPPGMRETLYFKDDDARLSFLQGNYITMTNMKREDFDRILLYKLSPINISVHATNPELRCRMLHNRFAGDIMDRIRELAAHQIEMNSQIVLCRGINDGEELERSVRELAACRPWMRTLSVVPVGLTKYRDKLEPLEPFDRETAVQVLDQLHSLQKECLKQYGTRFVYPSDEWYLLSGCPIPEEEYYEGYLQLENGVGMVRSLTDEVEAELQKRSGDRRKRKVSLVTGKLAAPVMQQLTEKIQECYPETEVLVYPIENYFFGTAITVAGLLTGQDILAQLKGRDLGEEVLLPSVLLRSGEDVLLDDMTVQELENALQTPVGIVQSDGMSLVRMVLGEHRK